MTKIRSSVKGDIFELITKYRVESNIIDRQSWLDLEKIAEYLLNISPISGRALLYNDDEIIGHYRLDSSSLQELTNDGLEKFAFKNISYFQRINLIDTSDERVKKVLSMIKSNIDSEVIELEFRSLKIEFYLDKKTEILFKAQD